MNDSRISWKRYGLRVLALFAVLFVIGLVTRMPAWQFPQIYALHGVLAAPFCAALASWHFARGGSVFQLAAATALLALVLGMMSAAMGLGFVAVAAFTLVVWALLSRCAEEVRRLATATAFGALYYPCALGAGLAMGAYRASSDAVLPIMLLLALSVALSLVGAFAASVFADCRYS